MRTIFGNVKIALIVFLLGGSLSFGQDNTNEIRGMDPELRVKLEKASEEALNDVTELSNKAEKLVLFRQTNEKAYGLPSALNELQKLQRTTEAFADNELKEVEDFYTSLQEKYNAKGYDEFNVAISKVINPFPGKKTNFPWSATTLEQNITWFQEFRSDLKKELK